MQALTCSVFSIHAASYSICRHRSTGPVGALGIRSLSLSNASDGFRDQVCRVNFPANSNQAGNIRLPGKLKEHTRRTETKSLTTPRLTGVQLERQRPIESDGRAAAPSRTMLVSPVDTLPDLFFAAFRPGCHLDTTRSWSSVNSNVRTRLPETPSKLMGKGGTNSWVKRSVTLGQRQNQRRA